MAEGSRRPWFDYYDEGMPLTYEYPDKTMYQLGTEKMQKNPEAVSMGFQSTDITAEETLAQINRTAAAMNHLGLQPGDAVTICLPNTPHTPIVFYAIQRLGAVCSMIHPLTPGAAVAATMRKTRSKWLVTLDGFLPRMEENLAELQRDDHLERVVACAIGDYLQGVEKLGFWAMTGRKIPPIPGSLTYIAWRQLQDLGEETEHSTEYTDLEVPSDVHAPAVYLQSGGTTGEPKTIMLSSYNMNALAVQAPDIINTEVPDGMKMLSILPFFHGFGLCMQMHTMFVNGIVCVLVPQFKPDVLANVLLSRKTEFMVGVPTLFEGLLTSKKLRNADLSFLRAVFCGGDSLSPDLKKRLDDFLEARGAKVKVREGYGLTETVTVNAVNPEVGNVPGSVGLPLPDIDMVVVTPGTEEVLPAGESGEICVTGPTVMLGYLDDPEGTAEALWEHKDGRTWVHTGDYGYIDERGYIYYQQRLKRIIKVSGIAIFPAEIEAHLADLPAVSRAAVIGVPHPYKMEVPYAYIVLEDGMPITEAEAEERRKEITGHLEKNMLRHAVPKGIEFVEELPQTRMGKIDYVKLRENYDEADIDITVHDTYKDRHERDGLNVSEGERGRD